MGGVTQAFCRWSCMTVMGTFVGCLFGPDLGRVSYISVRFICKKSRGRGAVGALVVSSKHLYLGMAFVCMRAEVAQFELYLALHFYNPARQSTSSPPHIGTSHGHGLPCLRVFPGYRQVTFTRACP